MILNDSLHLLRFSGTQKSISFTNRVLSSYLIQHLKNELRGLLDESVALEVTTKRMKDAAKDLAKSSTDNGNVRGTLS